MRIAAVLLLSSLTLHALEQKDVVGLWKWVFPEEWKDMQDYTEPRIEIWFGADGVQEGRYNTAVIGDFYYSTIRSEWKIEGGALLQRTVSGWSYNYRKGYTPIEPATAFIRFQAVLVPGNPRILRLKECETCDTRELHFISASRDFTLEYISPPGAAVRKAAPGRQAHRNPGSFYRFGVRHGNRSYDLKGRMNPTPLR